MTIACGDLCYLWLLPSCRINMGAGGGVLMSLLSIFWIGIFPFSHSSCGLFLPLVQLKKEKTFRTWTTLEGMHARLREKPPNLSPQVWWAGE